ncbi:unnamed protein product [Arctogadus glacialis]
MGLGLFLQSPFSLLLSVSYPSSSFPPRFPFYHLFLIVSPSLLSPLYLLFLPSLTPVFSPLFLPSLSSSSSLPPRPLSPILPLTLSSPPLSPPPFTLSPPPPLPFSPLSERVLWEL